MDRLKAEFEIRTAASQGGGDPAAVLKARATKDLEKATAGFESMLINEMLKSMWASVDRSSLNGEKDSYQADMYQDMFHQALSDSIAKGEGIGVKSFLKKELERRGLAVNVSESPRAASEGEGGEKPVVTPPTPYLPGYTATEEAEGDKLLVPLAETPYANFRPKNGIK